ncbi:MAG: 4-alpha-glucanotransferase [Betaproteobacteria bacterium]|nr:MAG: 4-alpha-glucanotransferase [Betaproteobacteria bacterium]
MKLPDRAAGVILHPTSLPGPHGVGDLGPDAYRFVDWLATTGQSMWQWLPTTPIGPGDSPYQSVSAFAGSPLMVALEPLIERGWLSAPMAESFDPDRVDFARVVPWRIARLREAFAGFSARVTAADRAAFTLWRKAQAYWLDDYAVFMALETAHSGACWWDWAAPLRKRVPAAMDAAKKQHAAEIEFWSFVQWCFDTQAVAIRSYANERGVALMGDLPIFIAHHSADCWARPDLYFLDDADQPTVIAGVPPDGFTPDGQRWGNPLYRWDKMAAEDFAWWSLRLKRAMSHADLFRIDHFRGFAGYWEIPVTCPTARDGRWVPGPGLALFDAIERALGKVPVVAEDLGLITPDVEALRDSTGFPGMKIVQFAFGGDGTHEFLPHNYTTNCVAYTGTHDNDTARGWWDQAPEHERAFAGAYLVAGTADIHWAMIRAACNSVAKIAAYPLQDILGLGAPQRMNIPGTLGGNNWTWRFQWRAMTPEVSRVLGLITAASGRADKSLIRYG